MHFGMLFLARQTTIDEPGTTFATLTIETAAAGPDVCATTMSTTSAMVADQ